MVLAIQTLLALSDAATDLLLVFRRVLTPFSLLVEVDEWLEGRMVAQG